MDWGDWISFGSLILAVIVAYRAHVSTKESADDSMRSADASERSATASERSAKASEDHAAYAARLATANEEVARQNVAMLEESRRIAAASEALAAENRRLAEHVRGMEQAVIRQADRGDAEAAQREADRRRSGTARFDLERGTFGHEGINLRLKNLGPHVAETVSAAVMHGDRKVGDSTEHRQLPPNDAVRVAMRSADLNQFISGENPNREFDLILNYDDGNEHHQKRWKLRFTGELALHGWQLQIDEAPEF